MDVDSFITAHTQEWKRLDDLSRGGIDALAARPPGEISDAVGLYLRVSTHLTLARSRFADPALERYLNDLVGRARQSIYAAPPATVRGFVRFFGARYRAEIRRTLPFILVAAAILVVVTLATWAWIGNSPEARLGLIPPAAERAIRHANGMRSPDLGPSQAVATTILLNNVQVAFLAFALGVTLGIGTVYVLVSNAVLLGLLAGAYGALGHAGAFWALILPHGLLELTAICIAAGAGLRMGWAIVDPGDRSRGQALAAEGTAAVIVVLGVIPAFMLAATIEGFVTGTAVPAVIQLGLGVVVSAAYLAFLFGPSTLRGRRAQSAPVAFIER